VKDLTRPEDMERGREIMTVTYSTETLATRLRGLQAMMADGGNSQIAARMGELAARLDVDILRVNLAFCGLFSAGKSSLINALVRQKVLATGAVPTTATVTDILYEGGTGQVALMDTPGIDSTDEAHEAAMEAALHRADLVALVMDYQHVEAEDNLDMARMLCDQGKQLILVIHQIDKHFDWELSFEEFCGRVEKTFAEYDVPYTGIFYTTTMTSEHNQLPMFQAWLGGLAADAERIVTTSLQVSARNLVLQYVTQAYSESVRQAENALFDTLGVLPFDSAEANAWIDEKSRQLRDMEEERLNKIGKLQAKQDSVRVEFTRTIDLAQISPYDTTELGRLYVESLRPGFRVGWLGGKEKTAKEAQQRLHAFLSDLMERTQRYLLWPLQNGLREFIQSAVWAVPEWMDDVEKMGVQLTPETCRNLLHEGALLSEQYPYQYVKDVVAHVKRQLSGQLNQCFDRWFPDALESIREEFSASDDQWVKLTRERDCLAAWESVQRQQRERISALSDGLQSCERDQCVDEGV
jgi:small GTP-binding protein